MKYIEGMTICIDVHSLYNEFRGETESNTINVDGNYYDLETIGQGVVCMDGEEVEIIQVNENDCLLKNDNSEISTIFMLTNEELKVATYQ